MDIKHWLAHVQVGDEVFVNLRSLGQIRFHRKATVRKRTPKQITVGSWVFRLNKDGTEAHHNNFGADYVLGPPNASQE